MTQDLKVGHDYDQREVMADLVAQQYRRNDQAFQRGSFRVRGDSAWKFSLRTSRIARGNSASSEKSLNR